ncbi:D-aminoacylase [Mycetohabitans rhizoxinica]|uniref:N-acyl-D-amino-acid deacylase family protein n=1 Tax=Mycetohabitans rhizoxinica TaxID=412963 RepID=UPI0030CE09F6
MHSRPEAADTLIIGAQLYDGTGAAPLPRDVALRDGRIVAIGSLTNWLAEEVVDAGGHALAPGFIDVHTHDDTHVIEAPQMLPKLSQGITTVIVGNCGISASPVVLRGEPPDPMNLLGKRDAFVYPRFADYVDAVNAARPAVNVAALVGHTALRNNQMDRLDRAATRDEIDAMRVQLSEALTAGALGLSTGLAYGSAVCAPTDEVMALAEPLAAARAVYTTHMRTEFDAILDAMDEAYRIGRHARVPVVISHLKCAGPSNWGRSTEVLASLSRARACQPVGCDCYPYSRSSSTLDVKQASGDIDITITWSAPHPEAAGKLLRQIAAQWGVSDAQAARRLQPAGAVYHNMSDEDVRRILSHPATMVGSDGLPNDPLPHPRLWGAFARVLGHYVRHERLLPLEEAIRKMTSLSARRFGLDRRGEIRVGYHADLVLFDPETVRDVASFDDPCRPAQGIDAVWVNGVLAYRDGTPSGARAGGFVVRGQPAGYDAEPY